MSSSFREKKVLVAGGTGFIGSHFAEHLVALGARVTITIHRRPSPLRRHLPGLFVRRGDLSSLTTCCRITRGMDMVLHCAGSVAGSRGGLLKGIGRVTHQLCLTANLLQACLDNGVARLLLFSSSTGYPPLARPAREEDFWKGDPDPRYLGYGWMRRYFERLAELANRDSKTRVTVIRPGAVYGPRDNFTPGEAHVIADLIERSFGKEPVLSVAGHPDSRRDFMYITDFVAHCSAILGARLNFGPINVASGRSVTIRDLAQSILRVQGLQNKKQVVFNEKPPRPFSRTICNKKLKQHLGGFSLVPLEQGLKMTIAWRKKQTSF